MEKNMKKNMYIYIYTKLNDYAIQYELTQYCKSTIIQENKFYKY